MKVLVGPFRLYQEPFSGLFVIYSRVLKQIHVFFSATPFFGKTSQLTIRYCLKSATKPPTSLYCRQLAPPFLNGVDASLGGGPSFFFSSPTFALQREAANKGLLEQIRHSVAGWELKVSGRFNPCDNMGINNGEKQRIQKLH